MASAFDGRSDEEALVQARLIRLKLLELHCVGVPKGGFLVPARQLTDYELQAHLGEVEFEGELRTRADWFTTSPIEEAAFQRHMDSLEELFDGHPNATVPSAWDLGIAPEDLLLVA